MADILNLSAIVMHDAAAGPWVRHSEVEDGFTATTAFLGKVDCLMIVAVHLAVMDRALIFSWDRHLANLALVVFKVVFLACTRQ